MKDFPFFPEEASTIAGQVDALYFVLLAVSLFFIVGIFSFLIYFAVRYRKGSKVDRSHPATESVVIELVWTFIPLVLVIGLFVWGAEIFYRIRTAPDDALEINVVAKQWMWKIQHPGGQREINELHIPAGKPVKLTMISQDVIHSFYVPAFRVKQDVLPGRYVTMWFQAIRPGTYPLYCAEYCGAGHSSMTGQVVVMEQSDFEQWLAGQPSGLSLVAKGERVFKKFGCDTCHGAGEAKAGPPLAGLNGSTVKLGSGRTVTADRGYIRESIQNPAAKIVAGYAPIMPTFEDQISEEELLQLVAYIESLEPAPEASGGSP
jgi:cytochrome c oxidase subunit 2